MTRDDVTNPDREDRPTMAAHDETTAPPSAPAETPVGGSLREQLRARREQLAAERHVDIEVHGYGDALVLRCRPVSFERVRAIRERATKGGRKLDAAGELNVQVDTLIAACEQVMTTRDGRRVGLEEEMPELGDGVVTLGDPRLARALGFEASGHARSIVYGVFNGNDMGIVSCFVEFSQWMADASAEVDDEFVGE